jgi:gliding motility-associated-like protein
MATTMESTVGIIVSPSGAQCEGTMLTFTAAGINGGTTPTYSWYVNGDLVSSGENVDTYNSSTLQNGDLVTVWMSTSVPCAYPSIVSSNPVVANILLYAIPEINISASPPVVCYGQPVTFVASALYQGLNPIYTFMVNGLNMQQGPTNIYVNSTLNENDLVSVNVVSNYQCLDSINTATSTPISVTINPLPFVDIQEELITIVNGQEIELISTTNLNNALFLWTSSLYLSCDTCLVPIAAPPSNITYILTVTDPLSGCAASDSVKIEVLYDFDIFLPIAFSPNGDGSNDVLYVRGHNIKNLLLEIYDRWGELVFTTVDVNSGWDGTYKGKPLDTGVFNYVLRFDRTMNFKSEIQKGNITLVR